MATIRTDNQYYYDIADAIREVSGVSKTYKPSEMSPAILTLTGGHTFKLPSEYQEYVDYALENLYTSNYTNLVVWDATDWIAVSFLMDDFTITEYNIYSTEIKATGWFTCGYTKSTGEWTSHDYTVDESPGGNYARYIVFASCPIEYNDETLFPVGITTMAEVADIAFDDTNLTATVTFVNGEVASLTWTEDTEGNMESVTIDGHTITVSEVTA